MTYSEFCDQIAPSVLELEKECSKMSLEDLKNSVRMLCTRPESRIIARSLCLPCLI